MDDKVIAEKARYEALRALLDRKLDELESLLHAFRDDVSRIQDRSPNVGDAKNA